MDTAKRIGISIFTGGLLSLALLMPLTLQSGVLDRITPLAWYFCPDTGQFAPRYWHGRSGGNDPDNWEACLDTSGKRVNSEATHKKIVFSVAGFWFCIMAPLWFATLGPLLESGTNRRRR